MWDPIIIDFVSLDGPGGFRDHTKRRDTLLLLESLLRPRGLFNLPKSAISGLGEIDSHANINAMLGLSLALSHAMISELVLRVSAAHGEGGLV